MGALVTYELKDAVAVITMDDGKVNALSPQMLSELNGAFDQAETDAVVVVLTGRPGVFSAGFSLPVLTGGGTDAPDLLRAGLELAERLLSSPAPIVIACSGHALAMAAFLLLSGDYRVGALGSYKIGANEVAIGMTMPETAIEICRQRLAPTHFNRAINNAEIFSPEDAVVAGFLDRVVPPSDLLEFAGEIAAGLTKLNMPAHAASKLRSRRQALTAIHAAIESDDAAFRASL